MRGIRLAVQAIIFTDNSIRSRVNHQEWYMSKMLKNFRTENTPGLYSASYFPSGSPCWITVPKIDVMAKARNKDIVSLIEEKNLYILTGLLNYILIHNVDGLDTTGSKSLSSRFQTRKNSNCAFAFLFLS